MKSSDEFCQFPTDTTTMLVGNIHCQFWVACESLLSFIGRNTVKVEEKCILQIYMYDLIVLTIELVACFFVFSMWGNKVRQDPSHILILPL